MTRRNLQEPAAYSAEEIAAGSTRQSGIAPGVVTASYEYYIRARRQLTYIFRQLQ